MSDFVEFGIYLKKCSGENYVILGIPFFLDNKTIIEARMVDPNPLSLSNYNANRLFINHYKKINTDYIKPFSCNTYMKELNNNDGYLGQLKDSSQTLLKEHVEELLKEAHLLGR